MTKLEVYERKDGDWGFRLKRKGRIILWSEGYYSKSNAIRALRGFLEGIKKLLDKYKNYEEFKNTIKVIKYTKGKEDN